jgi:hypothetical protein
MHIDVTSLGLVLVFTALCWYANHALNPAAELKSLVNVVIVSVVSILYLAYHIMTSNCVSPARP